MADKHHGEVITFYSYKGGSGRTMALSNVACLLAKQCSELSAGVLMIDWDLEAPGLHRFFFKEDVNNGFGLIDLFLELDASTSGMNLKEDEGTVNDILDRIRLEDYVIPTNIAKLSLLKAGCFDQNYSQNVNTFDWQVFYNRAPSLIRIFAEKLTERYEYVLIDSRTGYTDIGGICTMLMPQKLVVVFTPSRQSYTGMRTLIEKATKYRRRSPDFRPLLVYPLPSRIEFNRDDLRKNWRYGSEGITGYQVLFEMAFKEVYGLDNCDLDNYFNEIQIQQSQNYAYGEEIAVLTEKVKDDFSLSTRYKIFTKWIVDSLAPWEHEEPKEPELDQLLDKNKGYRVVLDKISTWPKRDKVSLCAALDATEDCLKDWRESIWKKYSDKKGEKVKKYTYDGLKKIVWQPDIQPEAQRLKTFFEYVRAAIEGSREKILNFDRDRLDVDNIKKITILIDSYFAAVSESDVIIYNRLAYREDEVSLSDIDDYMTQLRSKLESIQDNVKSVSSQIKESLECDTNIEG